MNIQQSFTETFKTSPTSEIKLNESAVCMGMCLRIAGLGYRLSVQQPSLNSHFEGEDKKNKDF